MEKIQTLLIEECVVMFWGHPATNGAAEKCSKTKAKNLHGISVFARDYSDPNKKGQKDGKIIKVIGLKTFLCELNDGRVWKRHLNQVKKGRFISNSIVGIENYSENTGTTLADDQSLEDVCNVDDAKTEVNIKSDKVPCDVSNVPAQCSTESFGNNDFQTSRRSERLKRKV